MTTIRVCTEQQDRPVEINGQHLVITIHHGTDQHAECFMVKQAEFIRILKNYSENIKQPER